MSPIDSGKRTQRIDRLLEISRNMTGPQELEKLLDTVVRAACELADSQKAVILMYEAETDLLKYVAGNAPDKEALKRIRVPVEKCLAGKAYKQNKPLVIQNVRPDSPSFKDIERVLGVEICSALAVPMIFQGETIGVIEAINKRDKSHYTEEDVTILESLVAQATVSILSSVMLDETKRAYAELEELEHMKSDFIAIASHELRTPLGLILGHATDLMDQLKDDQQRHQLQVIVRSANRLKKIIEDLGNVSAVQSGDQRVPRRAVNVATMITEVTKAFLGTAKSKDILLRTELPRVELVVDGDEEKLGLVLSNLLENAISFTDRNGHVLVTAERLPGYVKVSVIDDGIGIPAKDLTKVFDKFYQVESHLTRRVGGMGLGLSVAKVMVEMHDGQIWAESIVGKGSNFTFLLPSRSDREKTLPTGLKVPAFAKPFE